MGRLNTFLLAAATSACLASSEPIATPLPLKAEYEPGNLDVFEMDMYLSKGLTAKIIAKAGEPMTYKDGTTSAESFHSDPDGAAVFADESGTNPGGWVYVSNSEALNNKGGVGAVKFDASGNVIDYKMVLTGTSRNCNGGKTDWNTWISCEEALDRTGKVWQVDPFGVKDPVQISLGSEGGTWEAFAHDTRDDTKMFAFLTEDEEDGALQRMTINYPNSYPDPWNILLGSNTVDYLILEPDSYFAQTTGTFRWTTDLVEAKANAEEYYPNTEGMKIDGNKLRVVSKSLYGFFTLDLDAGTYQFEEPDFVGQPDQSITVVQDDGSKLTYFTEEAHPVLGFLGQQVGLYTRNEAGEYSTIIFGDYYSPETTGIAFSPNGRHMYFAYQSDGILFDVTRTDGLSFFSQTATPYGESYESSDDESSVFEIVQDGIHGIKDWLFSSRKGDDLF